MISVTESMDFFSCLVARHVTEPDLLLTESGDVIKFSDFSIYRYLGLGTRML